MNPYIPEIKVPLSNGRIIKTDCAISEYLAKGEEGGPRILSRSDLCAITDCPSKWHKLELSGEEPEDRSTRSTEFGSLVDCLLLQPHKFAEYYTMPPATYINSKKQEAEWTWKSSTCREWRDEQESLGKLVCADKERETAQAAVDWLLLDKRHGEQTKRLVEHSVKQVFVIADYTDADTGIVVPVKILTDMLPDQDDPEFGKSVFDLKTGVSAHPRAWRRAVFDGDYHVQGAMGLDIINTLPGQDRCDFRHLIVENKPPFEPAYRFLTTEYVAAGRLKYFTALKTYCRCVASGEWPSYRDESAMVLPDGYEACDLEPWMVNS